MANFSERFLLGFTSPRSPYLISKYIKVIEENNLDGKMYNSNFQKKFYNILSKAQVAGEEAGKAKDTALAGRDKLTRMPQALGFFITQSNKEFRITRAGKLLKDDDLFEDVFLHQILKFQLPSVLHRENKVTNKGYFRIKPFLELIRLIYTLGYLTYNELQIFGLTLTDYRNFNDTVKKIHKYRQEREWAKKQRKSLKQFDYNIQLGLFKDLYEDIITSGNINTRESKTETPEKYMEKKRSNWADYADSIFRVLRASGVVIYSKGRSLSINEHRKEEVKYILDNVEREIKPINWSREEFDSYISNPEIPVLLNDNILNLKKKLKEVGGYSEASDTVYVLKRKLNERRAELRKEKVKSQKDQLKLHREEDIIDILNLFEKIKNKEIQPASMRPTLFEWNVWRAMSMINHGDVKGNFIVDDSGMPISTASGGKSDIVGEYGEFNIGVEVTLSMGKKQYEMEGEPVVRHIGEMQVNKPSFGLFIADRLNDSVIYHFYINSLSNSDVYNGSVDIIPMETKVFIDFFKNAIEKDIQSKDLYSIHEFSKNISRQIFFNGKTEVDWHKSVIAKAFELVTQTT